MDGGAWWAAVHGIVKSRTWLDDFPFTFHFHALEKEMATHSSVLAWRIPGTGEPGGLPSVGLHRIGHDWSDLAAAADSHGEVASSRSENKGYCNLLDGQKSVKWNTYGYVFSAFKHLIVWWQGGLGGKRGSGRPLYMLLESAFWTLWINWDRSK